MKDKKLVKNYIILFVIFLVVFLVILYISKWNHVYNDYKLETPVIRGTLTYEINEVDLDHYVLENPNATIYMCTSSDEKCRKFEKDFKKLIENRNLEDKIIYLNLSNIDLNRFVNDFNNKYRYKVKLTNNFPALVEFNDGKITSLIEAKDGNELTMDEVTSFVNVNHIDDEM